MRRVNLPQGSPEWHAWRKTIIGASDCPVIMGKSPYKTLRQLYDEKTGVYEEKETENMRAGKALEPIIRERVSKELGIDFEPACYQSDMFGWAGASLDGINFAEDTFVEIKVNNKENHEIAKKGLIVGHHGWQMHHQSLVFEGREMKAFYCSYHMATDDLKIVPFAPCIASLEDIIDESEKFWKMVKEGNPPPLTDRDYEKVDNEYLILEAQGYEEAKKQLKYWEERTDAHKKALIQGIGRNAQVGSLKLTRGQRKGAVDYSSIPEIRGVNLEEYRKPPITVWTLD